MPTRVGARFLDDLNFVACVIRLNKGSPLREYDTIGLWPRALR
jgi:hypothetical protein